MEYLKIQNDIIKNYYNSSIFYGRKNFDYFGEKLDSGFLISDGHFIIIIPEKFFFLDFDKIFTANNKTCRLSQPCFDNTHEFYDITGIYEKDILCGTKTLKLKAFQFNDNPDKDKIFVDTRLLKHFSGDLVFQGAKYNCPVRIYENNILVGVVLPVNHKE